MRKRQKPEKNGGNIANLTLDKASAVREQDKLDISTITEADRPQLKQALVSIFAYKNNKAVVEEAYASIDGWLRLKALAHKSKINEKKLPYDQEYYALKNVSGKILAIVGVYTVQTSAPGFNAKAGSWTVARLGWTGVISDEQGKGYGKLIVELAMQEARKKEASVFVVETSPLWKNMHRLLKKLGFRSDANVKDYYGKGIDLHCFYADLEKVSPRRVGVNMIETYDVSKLEWLRPVFGKEKFAWLSEVIEKAEYAKKISEVSPSLIKATPFITRQGVKPIGFALLSTYSWEGEAANVPKATFVFADNDKEGVVAAAIAQKTKELGMRMLVVEMPKSEKPKLEKAFEKLGFASSPTIKGLYGTYNIEGKKHIVDQIIFAKNLAQLNETSL